MSMTFDHAAQVISELCYKPGWRFELERWNRFEGTGLLHIYFATPNFNEDQAPFYGSDPMHVDRKFPLSYALLGSDEELQFELIGKILQIETHEAREALRRCTSHGWVSAFHPHNLTSMALWSQLSGEPLINDLSFDAFQIGAVPKA